MASIIPLAFAAALYPTLLAGVIILLARDRPVGMLAAFLAGGVLISLTTGLVIVFALGGAISPKNQRSASPTVDLVLGILSLVLAIALWRRLAQNRAHARPAKTRDGPSWTQRTLGEGSAWAAFGAGLVLNLPGIWYLDALKDISVAKVSTGAAIGAILGFIVIMFALCEIPLIGYVIEPDGTRIRVQRAQAWGSAHALTVAIGAAVVTGLFLIVKGIAGLA